MQDPPDRWRLRTLLSAWAGYWLTLGAVTLAPLARTVWHISRLPSGGNSSISTSVGDGVLRVTTLVNGAPAWSGGAPLFTVALWVAGPPLLIWLVWLRMARRRDDASPFHKAAQPARAPSELGAGDPAPIARAAGAERDAAARVRVERR